jgi:hypothetical protein
MDKRWLCAGLSVLCFLCSAKLGWFRGLILPMAGVGFIFAGMWIWFAQRMALTSNQQPLYLPTPAELAAIKQAALAQAAVEQQRAVAAVSAVPVASSTLTAAPLESAELPAQPAPTGRAVFSLGTEAPIVRVKPPQN